MSSTSLLEMKHVKKTFGSLEVLKINYCATKINMEVSDHVNIQNKTEIGRCR